MRLCLLLLALSLVACQGSKQIPGEAVNKSDESQKPPAGKVEPQPQEPVEVPRDYTRIVCEPSDAGNVQSVRSSTSSLTENFWMTTFEFENAKNGLRSLWLQSANSNKASLRFISQEKANSVFQAEFDYNGVKPSTAVAIASFPLMDVKTSSELRKYGHRAESVAHDGSQMLLPSAKGDTYILIDVSAPQTVLQTLPNALSPRTQTNPVLSGTVAVFSEVVQGRLALRGLDLSNGYNLNYRSETGAEHQLSPVISKDGTLYWLENSQSKWFLRGTPILAQSAPVTLWSYDSAEVVPSLALMQQVDKDVLAITDGKSLEILVAQRHDQSITAVSASNYPIDQSILRVIKYNDYSPSLNHYRVLPSEWNNQWILSFGKLGGFLTFDMKTKAWTPHARLDLSSQCLFPHAVHQTDGATP